MSKSESRIACPERTHEQEYHMQTLNSDQRITLAGYSRIIFDDWVNMTPYARPYVEAMARSISIDKHNIHNAMYINDSFKSIVLYFLANAASWRGEVAREVKKQLKEMVGVK